MDAMLFGLVHAPAVEVRRRHVPSRSAGPLRSRQMCSESREAEASVREWLDHLHFSPFRSFPPYVISARVNRRHQYLREGCRGKSRQINDPVDPVERGSLIIPWDVARQERSFLCKCEPPERAKAVIVSSRPLELPSRNPGDDEAGSVSTA
jgi:hypothetical protein